MANHQVIARSRSNSRETVREARSVFTDLPAQLSPSTREAMAAAKHAKQMAVSMANALEENQEQMAVSMANALEENQNQDLPNSEAPVTTVVENKMNELGTN
ncbi:hypothetical protein OESDEN_14779 [Oesophagostomum dentatum]|uniref:Uncharacterized protein n=1 Tax=Oesophagostomum dentatum TaxID=61180 RepID=A0A0B1SJH6_OESDE|nr:hypothetical protein OESDEN_14779 [Oesophagostomum dentatum]